MTTNPNKITVIKDEYDIIPHPWYKHILERIVSKLLESHAIYEKKILYTIKIPCGIKYELNDFIKEYNPEYRSYIDVVQFHSENVYGPIKRYAYYGEFILLEELMGN